VKKLKNYTNSKAHDNLRYKIPHIIEKVMGDNDFFYDEFEVIGPMLQSSSLIHLMHKYVSLIRKQYSERGFNNKSIMEDLGILQYFLNAGYEARINFARKYLPEDESDFDKELEAPFLYEKEPDYLNFTKTDMEKGSPRDMMNKEQFRHVSSLVIATLILKYISEIYLLCSAQTKDNLEEDQIIELYDAVNTSSINLLVTINMYDEIHSLPLRSYSDTEEGTVKGMMEYAENNMREIFQKSGRKGGLSTHRRKSAIEDIANDTWNEHPKVPVKQLAEKIKEYEENNISGHPPSLSAIESWLASHPNNPKLRGRQARAFFDLVTKEK
jgi:hypothetical protein